MAERLGEMRKGRGEREGAERGQRYPTRNIMQDLVKNLAIIRQDFLTFLT